MGKQRSQRIIKLYSTASDHTYFASRFIKCRNNGRRLYDPIAERYAKYLYRDGSIKKTY